MRKHLLSTTIALTKREHHRTATVTLAKQQEINCFETHTLSGSELLTILGYEFYKEITQGNHHAPKGTITITSIGP
jgi:hypothetical protein